MQEDIPGQLDALAREADQLIANLEYYWNEEGVSELSIFIDPDLYQYLDRLYHESYDFAARCKKLTQLAEQLRAA